MAKNFIQNGEAIHVVAKTEMKSGSLVHLGEISAVVITDIPQGETGAASVIGVWEFPAKSADNITQGMRVYWDESEKAITATKGTNKAVGIAWMDSPATQTTVMVKINA